ncbi:MAG: hypothetical protein Q8J97_12440, partial [Flavobacteriaceae bacterium]|nr:hypothetical protein [Flavobacteriaceae bacterium]
QNSNQSPPPKMSFDVFVADSTITGAGRGVFVRCRDDAHAIPCGTVLTKYPGRVLTAEEYFTLDATSSPLIHYVIATDKGPLVCHTIESEDPQACGHKINDARCLELPDGMTSDRGDSSDAVTAFQTALREYIALRETSLYNVRIDPTTCDVVATRPIVSGEELYFCYGPAYWASRVYSALYWSNKRDGDRELARRLRSVCKSIDGTSEYPPVPPHAVLQTSGSEDGGVVLIDAHSGAELDDTDVLLSLLAMCNRDAGVLRLKKPVRRQLLLRLMVASAAQSS